jgi:hypothetical protein
LLSAHQNRKMTAFTARTALAVLTLIFAIGSALPALAQSTAVNADVVRQAILDSPLWHVDRGNGTTTWHFEMRGADLWAKAFNTEGRNMPDVKVEVTNDGLTWIDPGGQRITLHYDPPDLQFPFKGADEQGRVYEFTPK